MKPIILIAVILIGCSVGNKPPHYYSLIESTEHGIVKHTNQREVIVEPVRLSRQLDGSRMVYQLSATETVFLNHHLWTQNLSQQVTQFMVNKLRMANKGFWPTTTVMAGNSDSIRIRISLDAFNGSYQGVAVVKGEWQIFNSEHRLYGESFSYSIPMSDSGYDELIKALSKALILLSRSISTQLNLR